MLSLIMHSGVMLRVANAEYSYTECDYDECG